VTSVTIDLEDLETLVMAIGALKTIEGALAQRKSDPFVRQYLDFTAAHDRLASAMRNARRAESGTLIQWDGELTPTDETLLRELDRVRIGVMEVRDKEDYDSIAAKGCVVIGQCVAGIVWPGAAQAEIKPYHAYAVRITPRGREKLAKIDAEKVTKIGGP
jgi:hypothetical protein